MKRLYVVSAVLSFAASGALAQGNSTPEVQEYKNKLGQTITVTTAEKFLHTKPQREWPTHDDELLPTSERKEVEQNWRRPSYVKDDEGPDPVRQSTMGPIKANTLRANFNGMNGNGIPPDPTGAAGPNHYVQAVNTSVRIYDKTGSGIGGAFSLSTLWPGSSNAGDPIVMYDRHADRWFISQFQLSNQILIAISETNDPTGSYYAYSFNMGSFPDYPKYSIWWDGYYMTSNSGNTAVVFERDKMLTGDPTAQMVRLNIAGDNNAGFSSVLPADADGPLPPDGTPCYFFNLEDNAWAGVSQDQIEVFEMTTDWVTPTNTVVTSSMQIPTQTFSTNFGFGFDNISQPGTGQKLDAIPGVLMFRAQHMRWFDFNTIVLSWVVDVGGDQGGVRWLELRDQMDGNWQIYQEGTYAPDNGSRWMSSAAMDELGNIGIAYSYTNTTTTEYPGIRYTGRQKLQQLGTLPLNEVEAVAGGDFQTGTNRYGDYGHMSLDPDGTTFWYTGEYLNATGFPRTRIFSFSIADWDGIEDEDPHYAELTMNVFHDGNAIQVKAEGIHGNEVALEVIGFDGKLVHSQQVIPSNGQLNEAINTAELAPATYFVRIANSEFQKVEKIVLAK